MDKRKGVGALLLFVGAFGATKYLMVKGEWTMSHYLLLAGSAVLIGLGIYVILKADSKVDD